MISSYKLAPLEWKPQDVPTNEQLKLGFEAQTDTLGKAVYLFFAVSGLRRGELLSLKKENIQWETRAIIPEHFSRTKRSGLTFFNVEAEFWLKQYLSERGIDNDPRLFIVSDRKLREIWNNASSLARCRITAKRLRLWHSVELGAKGVGDRFVDVFQSRCPKNVLAKHYTGRGLERLKKIYDNANLLVSS